MGSTGHGIYKQSRSGNVNDETFGIGGAVNYKGKVPDGSGLSPVGANKITLKLPFGKQSNILFQFRLIFRMHLKKNTRYFVEENGEKK